MYGSLQEIDLRSLLELIENGQRSGQLLIESSSLPLFEEELDSKDRPNFGLIFFKDGQITYAIDRFSPPRQRLQDYLRRYQVESALERLPPEKNPPQYNTTFPITPRNIPEYNNLWLLLEHHVITAAQGRQILQNLVQETLFDLLSVDQGNFILKNYTPQEPLLTQIEISPAMSKVMRQRQQWQQLYPYITSPAQRPLLTKGSELKKSLTSSAYRSLTIACQGQLSLRRIARYLNKDLITISHALYPYIQQGLLKLLGTTEQEVISSPSNGEESSRSLLKVICIDEEQNFGQSLGTFLEQLGYKPLILSDPVAAISVIVQEPPHLILLTSEMSNFSGEVILSLRQAHPHLNKIPVILLTPENTDPLQLTKLQLLGVSECLTQPVQESELLRIVKRHLK